ncbi:hypothetical protein PPL_11592 [Heterostelium album PN500]|uniref:Uncharacterized protein n=1 Tax=Heterostelium pallidum (strain ATCC 26659 / Pp 5 / PN500) TaxID=670386 RepID=D3BV67_HETP5|nr:hypothetical protein PPL_11592 [Heterostelium album PN500]EFA74624.1 hypothetical protein PPL_11592 [Heterostelium album PN500]|eukprot:XP_020426758.1 hypothetical protein PPL_11592 [Heterostelium album PN500]
MKLTFNISILIVLLSILNVVHSAELNIGQYIMVAKNEQFISINTTDGTIIKNVNMAAPFLFFHGFLSGNSEDNTMLLLVTDFDLGQDLVVEYSINNNTFTEVMGLNYTFTGTQNPQYFAYDPVYQLAAIPDLNLMVSHPNLTVFIWDFKNQEFLSISLPTGPLKQRSKYPVGSYDPTTGDYHIIYEPITSLGTYYIVFNLWSKSIVQEPIFFNGFVMKTPQIVYFDNQVFFIDLCQKCNYTIYNVSIATATTQIIYTVPNRFPAYIFSSTLGVKGSTIVLFSSLNGEEYTTTVIDLATQDVHISPAVKMILPIRFEWISAGF